MGLEAPNLRIDTVRARGVSHLDLPVGGNYADYYRHDELPECFISIEGARQLGFNSDFLISEVGLPPSTDNWSEDQLKTPQLLLVPEDLVAEYLLSPFNEQCATEEDRSAIDAIPSLSQIIKSMLRPRLAAIDWINAEYNMDITVEEDILVWIGPLTPLAAE